MCKKRFLSEIENRGIVELRGSACTATVAEVGCNYPGIEIKVPNIEIKVPSFEIKP